MKEVRIKISQDVFNGLKSGTGKSLTLRDTDGIEPGDLLLMEEYITGKYPPFSCRYTGAHINKSVRCVTNLKTETSGEKLIRIEF